MFEKCFSFANVFFTTVHLHTNVKPSVWNVAVFISTERNGSYVIRQNNIKQKTCVYYFLIQRKKLFGQPNRRYDKTAVCKYFFSHYIWNKIRKLNYIHTYILLQVKLIAIVCYTIVRISGILCKFKWRFYKTEGGFNRRFTGCKNCQFSPTFTKTS